MPLPDSMAFAAFVPVVLLCLQSTVRGQASDFAYGELDGVVDSPGDNWRSDANGGRIQFADGARLNEGDVCTDAHRRWTGLCTVASACPSVLNEYRTSNRKPTVCSYRASELVVCCPDAQQSGTSNAFPSVQQLPSFERPVPFARPTREQSQQQTATVPTTANVRLSQQKCDEYSRLATHTGTFTLLSIITSVDKVDIPTCAYPTGLIVGGIKTKVGEFPHMAVIGWRDDETGEIGWNCGGSLISEYFVLTAGHCAAVRGVRPDVVRLGEQNLVRQDDRARPQDFGVADVLVHPEYKTSSHYHDIAVVRLAKRVVFSKFIRPACLWQDYSVNSSRAVATGWGQVEFSGSKSDDLLKVPLDIVDNLKCSAMYDATKRLRHGLRPEQLCAGFLSGGKDTCQGDSGGPLQVLTPKNQCIFHIVGVTSFGRACAARNTAGVYTRVSSYLDWLESVVWK